MVGLVIYSWSGPGCIIGQVIYSWSGAGCMIGLVMYSWSGTGCIVGQEIYSWSGAGCMVCLVINSWSGTGCMVGLVLVDKIHSEKFPYVVFKGIRLIRPFGLTQRTCVFKQKSNSRSKQYYITFN